MIALSSRVLPELALILPVEVVGERPMGQASGATGKINAKSACSASAESALLVIPMSGIA